MCSPANDDDECTSCTKEECCDELEACAADEDCNCYMLCAAENENFWECFGECEVNPQQNEPLGDFMGCSGDMCADACGGGGPP